MEVLFGGVVGFGKLYLMWVVVIVWCCVILGFQVYFFCCVCEDFYKNYFEGFKGFWVMLVLLVLGGWCWIIGDEICFWNGSWIYFCYCKVENDVYKYQGVEIYVLLIDELMYFIEFMYCFLCNCVCMVGINLFEEYCGKFLCILCGLNLGNMGYFWVKIIFIIGMMLLVICKMLLFEGGMLCQFILVCFDDNLLMVKDDLSYMDCLLGFGLVLLVKVMCDGDWDVVEGVFFDEWSNV